MRWQVPLQLAVGLGALFGFGYLTVDRFVGPPVEHRVVETAEARSIVAASEVSSAWERSRSGRRALIRALAESPALGQRRPDVLSGALQSAAAQMGGDRAALIDRRGKVTAVQGEGAEALAGLKATTDALSGAATVRFERLKDTLLVAAAAPREDGGALVVTAPLGEAELRSWIRGLPAGVAVAVFDQERLLASTLPPKHAGRLGAPTRIGPELVSGTKRFRTAHRTFSGDAGTKLQVVGFAAVDTAATDALVDRARLLIMALAGLAFLLSAMVVALAPKDDVRGLIEDFNKATSDIPVNETQPLPPISAPGPAPEPQVSTVEPARATPRPPSAPVVPAVPAEPPPASPAPEPAPLAPAPSLEQVTRPRARPRPESDTSFALDAEHQYRSESAPDQAIPLPSSSSPGGPVPLPPSDPPLRAPSQPPLRAPSQPPLRSSSDAPLRAPSQPLPPPGGAVPGRAGPESSPFEQIAAAAVSKPPAPMPAPAPPVAGTGDQDLVAPKGVDLSDLAARAAAQGSASSPPSYPEDLPGLKAEPSASTPDNLPGLRESPPKDQVDPWQNPSAPPPSPPSPDAGPVAYDEEHYRVVYNDFVASKARLGEVVDNLTYEGFRSKLRSSEEALINQHGCRAVRFQVLVRDNTVSLRPQLVR